MMQFTSDGHVLGFGDDGYFVSNGKYALRVRFEGARASAPSSDDTATEAGASPGGKPEKAAPLSHVSYSEVWPGIGVAYDTLRGGIARSTWTLAPGADPASIRLRYNSPVEVTASGELSLRFDTGSMTESRPVAWQEVDGHRRHVDVTFQKLAEDLVGFRVGKFRQDLPLVIDPTLTWNTFLGGTEHDSAGAISIDDNGNVYVGGSSYATWGTPVRAYTVTDAFVAKLDPSGALTWNTFLGGNSYDFCAGIAVDGNGNVYVGGSSYSTWGSPVRAYSSSIDAFVAKLDSSGALLWNTFLGGNADEGGGQIAIDGDGNAYAGGYSYATWGSPVRAYSSSIDAFVAKLDSSGALTWNTFLGGIGSEGSNAIAVDDSGNIYVSGFSAQTWGSPVRAYTSATDAFAAKLDSSGALTWNTFLGGIGSDSGYGIATDGAGNVYVVGSSYDDPWGSPVRAYSGSRDAFVAKLDSSGTLTWNTFLGNQNIDEGRGIAVDSSGNIYVSGYSAQTWGSPVRAYTSGNDAFAASLDSSGALTWNTFLGGIALDDIGNGIAADGNGNVYVSGYSTYSWGSPVRAYNDGNNSDDAFVAKLHSSICGDAVTEGAEQCDDGNTASGDCCAPDCTFEASLVTCRASAGVCDTPEHCTGASSACPANAFVSPATMCRASGGVCDLTEKCTGSSSACPTDARSTSVCRASSGTCDMAETCDGTAVSCPANSFSPSGTVCRASSGVCDAAENCTGTSATCPANSFASTSTTCRASGGICDVAEKCTGASATCPADILASSVTACRTSAGVCDVSENCTGVAASCPSDIFASSLTNCHASGGVCDTAQNCSGTSAICPAGGFAPSSTICRASAGLCDLAESCTGSSASCPTDSFASGTTCRASAGICDVSESCSGAAAACPADTLVGTTSVCRAAAGVCDVAENCTGTSVACPIDTFTASSTRCRTAAGVCDIAETCTGASAACPADLFASTSTTCRGASGVCDVVETCAGAGPSCPADALASSATICRSAGGDCDFAERCTGSGSLCPSDIRKGNGAPCGNASDTPCNHADTCNGSGNCLANLVADGASCDADTCTSDRCSAGQCVADRIPNCPLLPVDPAAGDEFGFSVALTSELLVVGAPATKTPGPGRVHLFRATESGYAEQTQTIPIAIPFEDSNQAGEDEDFGTAADTDQNTVVVGAPFDVVAVGETQSHGSASVFFFNGNAWIQQAKLIDTTGLCAELGTDVAISADTVVLGAPGGDCALVFRRADSQWALAATLKSASTNVRFGQSVDVSGDSILVGAPGALAGTGCSANGAVFAFRRSDAQWNLETTIDQPDGGGEHSCFGIAVAVDGENGVVGAPQDDSVANNAGAAYIVEHAPEVWSITEQLLASPASAAGDGFGASVDIRKDVLIVGATGVAAYLFQLDGEAATSSARALQSKWEQRKIYRPPGNSPATLSKFAFAVAVTPGKAAAGAPGGAPNGIEDAGAVYPSDSAPLPGFVCGNGTVTADEDCDDGNTTWKAGQYCNASCKALACGDANDSHSITTADALFALKTAVKIATCDLLVCDVNRNGAVSTSDALQILKKAVGGTVTLVCR